MREVIFEYLGNYLESLYKKILEEPIRNLFVLVISIFIIFTFAQHFYEEFSVFSLIGYLLLCLKGLTKIIDNPQRTITWAVGVVIGAITSKIFLETFIPSISFKNFGSVLGMLVIFYVVVKLYLKSKELKSY